MANPNPSPETRFKPGVANGGKTSAQKKFEYEAAAIAAELRFRALSGIKEKLDAGEIDPADLAKDGFLRLFKDSEDRAHGTPKATSELTGAGGGPIALTIQRTIVDPQG